MRRALAVVAVPVHDTVELVRRPDTHDGAPVGSRIAAAQAECLLEMRREQFVRNFPEIVVRIFAGGQAISESVSCLGTPVVASCRVVAVTF